MTQGAEFYAKGFVKVEQGQDFVTRVFSDFLHHKKIQNCKERTLNVYITKMIDSVCYSQIGMNEEGEV